MSIGFGYIYYTEDEVLRVFVAWPRWFTVIVGNWRGKILIHNGFKYQKKTDKGENLFIDVVGEKNAWQI